jgi:N-formylglutamate deformylase
VETYRLQLPTARRIPVLLSVPHCGTAFPDEIKKDYTPELIEAPDDTDWFVDRLYDFAPSLGITMISAVLSRWVIDLNRHPESKPLYSDGRIITHLCPVTTFLGKPIYRDTRKEVEPGEVQRRTELYFNPYHEELSQLLAALRSEFGHALLWDCHSIRQVVPTIQKNRFPDLILGSVDGLSADQRLIDVALKGLETGVYTLRYNHPFKGGYITRNFGKPDKHQHALQLEMSKVNYMDDSERKYDPGRAEKIGEVLYNTLSDVGKTVISLKD